MSQIIIIGKHMKTKAQQNNINIILIVIVGIVIFWFINQNSSGNISSQEVSGSTSGIEIYLTDKPAPVQLDLNIIKIELIKDGESKTVYSGNMPVTLKEDTVQKLIGDVVSSGTYTSLKITFSNSATAKFEDGTTETIEMQTKVWSISINEVLKGGRTHTIIIDLPVDTALVEIPFENKYVFQPSTPELRKAVRDGIDKDQIRAMLRERLQNIDSNNNGKIEQEEILTFILEELNNLECPSFDNLDFECDGDVIDGPKIGDCQFPPICIKVNEAKISHDLEEDCLAEGGFWNECGSPCLGTGSSTCVDVCEAHCECGGEIGYTCPINYVCKQHKQGELGKCVLSSKYSKEELMYDWECKSKDECQKNQICVYGMLKSRDYTVARGSRLGFIGTTCVTIPHEEDGVSISLSWGDGWKYDSGNCIFTTYDSEPINSVIYPDKETCMLFEV